MTPELVTAGTEAWKPVDETGEYEVSNFGRVRSSTGHLKHPTLTRHGNLVVNLYASGQSDVRAVHSIVANAFLGPRPPGHMVVHLDEDRTNCRASNLSYAPLSRRVPRDSAARGRYLVGKLTRNQAEEIRTRALEGESTMKLAHEFGVSSALVSNIKSGKKWKS